MRCRTVRRWLPLYAGRDLPPRRMQRTAAHIRICPRCRKESEFYADVLRQTRTWLQQVVIGWEESEWRSAVRKTAERRAPIRFGLWPWPFKPVWGYALMVLVAAALTFFVVQPWLVPDGRPFDSQVTAISPPPPQDVVAVTIVSRDTGLKINWFFNKNFNLEEETE